MPSRKLVKPIALVYRVDLMPQVLPQSVDLAIAQQLISPEGIPIYFDDRQPEDSIAFYDAAQLNRYLTRNQ